MTELTPTPPRTKRFLPFAGKATLLAGLILIGVAALAVLLPGPHTARVTVVLPRGSGYLTSVESLAQADVLRFTPAFHLAAIGSGNARRFKAGEYEIPARATAWQIIRQLAEGRTVIRRLTIAEGWTVKEIAAYLQTVESLTGTVPEPLSEGTLLPETYHYTLGDAREKLVQRMQGDMQKTLSSLWAARDPLVPLKTPQEALTLASLVEEETGVASERPRVAAVFYNRLRIGMKLQTDPTVLYGLGRGGQKDNRSLTYKDLASKTPYNTYVIDGLPPGPIACPGKEALQAVLHPPTTEELYFVADGEGGHRFAKTLEEHNENVRAYRNRAKTP